MIREIAALLAVVFLVGCGKPERIQHPQRYQVVIHPTRTDQTFFVDTQDGRVWRFADSENSWLRTRIVDALGELGPTTRLIKSEVGPQGGAQVSK